MTEIIRTGAFLQQCWSVHPLCVQVRRMTGERRLGLACTSCRFAHYLTLGSVLMAEAAAGVGENQSQQTGTPSDGLDLLGHCLHAHAPALSLREMDVFRDSVLLRCAECRRHYDLSVSAFETQQR